MWSYMWVLLSMSIVLVSELSFIHRISSLIFIISIISQFTFHYTLNIAKSFYFHSTWDKLAKYVTHCHEEYSQQIQILQDDTTDRGIWWADGELQTMQLTDKGFEIKFILQLYNIPLTVCTQTTFRYSLLVLKIYTNL